MSLEELSEKINNLIENDDTENFYALISELIEENKEYPPDLNKSLDEVFQIISKDISEVNQEEKLSFNCLFFEILISENIDFSSYLQQIFIIMEQNYIYSDENIKRLINICSNASLNKKELFHHLIQFSKNHIEYLYIIFSLVGFKDIIIKNLSDNWKLLDKLLDKTSMKSDSNIILKCLELLINLAQEKFKPYASSTTYKALDYLTETDIELQKRSLMIINSLTKYCDESLLSVKDNIINFLNALRSDNLEIKNICKSILKHFKGEDFDENENMEEIEEKDLKEEKSQDEKDEYENGYEPKKDDYKYRNKYNNYDNELENEKENEENYYESKKDYNLEQNYDASNIDINLIVKKIKDLSDKQIIILDSIEQYKNDTKRLINQKKMKIQSLEAKIEELKEKIRIEKSKKQNSYGKTNYQIRRKKNKNDFEDYDDY